MANVQNKNMFGLLTLEMSEEEYVKNETVISVHVNQLVNDLFTVEMHSHRKNDEQTFLMVCARDLLKPWDICNVRPLMQMLSRDRSKTLMRISRMEIAKWGTFVFELIILFK